MLAALLLLTVVAAPRDFDTTATPDDTSNVLVDQTPAQPASDPAQPDDEKKPQTPDDEKKPQTPDDEKKPPTPVHTGIRALLDGYVKDLKGLPSTDNLYIALGGGAAAFAAHQVDGSLNVHFSSHYTLVNDLYAPAKYYGDTPAQVGLSLATYAFGRIFHHPKVSHLGMDLLRAQMIAETLVEPLKYATRRERPDGSNNLSFPSGHSAVTFAGATVLERHLGWKASALAYVVAAYVATSRLHDNVHYLSDVTFGAAVGTIAGRTVTVHGPAYWSFVPVKTPGGVALVVSHRFQ